ncbi:outer membrane protein [Parvularcula oceani]|uniref:outer membrane protein n=1 Tax=Parvularcula oceani TaxID=1247963 RepID=UPI0004E213E1|nr:outer membrane beta-barrel protein [Parvularcula oceani]
MRTIIAAALAASASCMPAAAQDGGRFYLGTGLGAAFPGNGEYELQGVDLDGLPLSESGALEPNTGVAGSLLLGYRIRPRFALEFESSARLSDTSTLDENIVIGTSLLSLNAVLYGKPGGRFVPYGGIGIGIAEFRADDLEDDAGIDLADPLDRALGYQVKGGILLPFARSHALGLEAAYHGSGTFEGDDVDAFGDPFTMEQDYGAFNLNLTYRYQFGGFAGQAG